MALAGIESNRKDAPPKRDSSSAASTKNWTPTARYAASRVDGGRDGGGGGREPRSRKRQQHGNEREREGRTDERKLSRHDHWGKVAEWTCVYSHSSSSRSHRSRSQRTTSSSCRRWSSRTSSIRSSKRIRRSISRRRRSARSAGTHSPGASV